MTTQHTKGPWQVNTHPQNYGDTIETVGEEKAIADVRWLGVRPTPEALANAHLIASSPQLLEAANDMLANIQRLRTCPKCKERECDCWEGAAKAIAAATGGPSAP